MAEHEYTPQEDARYDYLMDVLNKDASEAREILSREHRENVGATATAAVVENPAAKKPNTTPKTPHYSRRGGRAFPEPSDSELDPHWNVGRADDSYIPTEETIAAAEKVKEESREDAIKALASHFNLSYLEAAARYKAQHEVRHRY